MTPAPGVTLEMLDKAFDRTLARFWKTGLTPATSSAPRRGWSPTPYTPRDSQSDLARWYGSSLAIGQTLRDVEEWPARIERVNAEDVVAAARRWLDHKPAVTGHLMPLDRRGGLRQPRSPAPPRGAKKTKPMETLMQKHFPVSPSHSAVNVDVVTSPRGLKFWLVRSYAVPLVSLEFAMRGGAAQDPAEKAGLGTLTRAPRRGGGRSRFASVSSRSGRESGRNVVPLRPRPLERADAHAGEEPRSRRRVAAACGQCAAVRRGAVRARARAHERAAAPRSQRSGDGGQPQLEGEVFPITLMASRPTARSKRWRASSGPISCIRPSAGLRATNC